MGIRKGKGATQTSKYNTSRDRAAVYGAAFNLYKLDIPRGASLNLHGEKFYESQISLL